MTDGQFEELIEALKEIKIGLAFLATALFFMATYVMTDALVPGTFLRGLCHTGPAILALVLFIASIATLWGGD